MDIDRFLRTAYIDYCNEFTLILFDHSTNDSFFNIDWMWVPFAGYARRGQISDRIAITGKVARDGIQTSSNWLINYGFVRTMSPL